MTLRITDRDIRIMFDLAEKYAEPFHVLRKRFFPDCVARSTSEERLNKLVHAGYINKHKQPMLFYWLTPKGARVVEKHRGSPPPKQYLQGRFGNNIGSHLAISIFAARHNLTLIRQRDAAEKLGVWCDHKDPSRVYFTENSVTFALSANTSMRVRQLIRACFSDGRTRLELNGDAFERKLEEGTFKWCLLVSSRARRSALFQTARELAFPAEGRPPEHSLRIECVQELARFAPRRKTTS